MTEKTSKNGCNWSSNFWCQAFTSKIEDINVVFYITSTLIKSFYYVWPLWWMTFIQFRKHLLLSYYESGCSMSSNLDDINNCYFHPNLDDQCHPIFNVNACHPKLDDQFHPLSDVYCHSVPLYKKQKKNIHFWVNLMWWLETSKSEWLLGTNNYPNLEVDLTCQI